MIGVAIIGSGLYVKQEHIVSMMHPIIILEVRHTDYHQPAALKCDKISLKAIYSRSLKSAEATIDLIPEGTPKPELYSDDSGSGKSFKDLLTRDDIGAVVIALPITKQPEFIKLALDSGKHVLAEKPVAKDVETAQDLIAYAEAAKARNGATFAVAENLRFYGSYSFAKEQSANLGKVTHFSVRVFNHMKEDNKWYNTPWRSVPEYQGGFLLDGGAHFAAVTRMLLGKDVASTVQARSALVRPHLPPIDSISAIIITKSGAIGSYQHSAGCNLSSFEFDAAYENGAVKISGEKVTVTPSDGQPIIKEFPRKSCVTEEVAEWAAGIERGSMNPLQSAQEGLGDLEFLEKMFVSGETQGAIQTYSCQI